MTNKEANYMLQDFRHNGYTIKHGYCCYQDDNISKYDLIKLGYNTGVYGWNWTIYLNPANKTIYISNYRNLPKEAHN